MTLKPGTMLGPYEILSLIGAGGMGEVYKARDSRLNRIVAIKVLPAHLAERAELRERFQREAHAIANLQHAHICVLYDIGQQEGAHYLVMEFLEGETLAQRLLKGSLPLDQVLRYAIEVADALDQAHRKGYFHRDIKPANIMLTKEGSKLLDFGLAKLKQEAARPNVPQSQIPTEPSALPPFHEAPRPAGRDHGTGLTADGTVLGTVQHMAPEQVEGKIDDIDGRTDIFAFGAVVYEMLTGKKAFEGKSQASVIAKILEHDPPPMSSLQPMTPPALDHVVKRCLAKEQEKRWQSANDLCDELTWITQVGSQAGIPAPVLARRKLRERLAWGGAAAILVAFLGILAVLVSRNSPIPQAAPSIRFSVSQPENAAFSGGAGADTPLPAVSPDGLRVAFTATSNAGGESIWIRSFDSLTARMLPGTDRGYLSFWSPDSRYVGFFADGKLKKIDVPAVLPWSCATRPLGDSRQAAHGTGTE